MRKRNDLLSRITVDSGIMFGKPTIRKMRITVDEILRAFADGVSERELLEEYPELEKEDFQAVYAYVNHLVEEERMFPFGLCIWIYQKQNSLSRNRGRRV